MIGQVALPTYPAMQPDPADPNTVHTVTAVCCGVLKGVA